MSTQFDNLNLLSPTLLKINKKTSISIQNHSNSRHFPLRTPPSTPKNSYKVRKNSNSTIRRTRRTARVINIQQINSNVIEISSDDDSDGDTNTVIKNKNTKQNNDIIVNNKNNLSEIIESSSNASSDFDEVIEISSNSSEDEQEEAEINKETLINNDIQKIAIVSSVPSVPSVPSPPKQSIYVSAKKLFHQNSHSNDNTSFPLIGRTFQFNQLDKFFNKNIPALKSDFLYIFGPPGTGKTAQTLQYLHHFTKIHRKTTSNLNINENNHIYQVELNEKVRKISVTRINCMTICNMNITKLFIEILNNFHIDFNDYKTYKKYFHQEKNSSITISSPKDLLFYLFSSRTFSDHNILLLDEIDSLLKSNSNYHQNLIELFSMTRNTIQNYNDNENDSDNDDNIIKTRNDRLIIIGISNDLRFLAEKKNLNLLKKKSMLNINSIQFGPYSENDIYNIIQSQLLKLKNNQDTTNMENNEVIPLFNPIAIRLISKKCANTGDLRKVFNICFKAIEKIETTVRDSLSKDISSIDIKEMNYLNAPKVSIGDVSKLFSLFQNDLVKTKFVKLNFQSKILLSVLVNFENRIREENEQKIEMERINSSLPKIGDTNIGKNTDFITNIPTDTSNHANNANIINDDRTITVDSFYQFYKKMVKYENLLMVSCLSKSEFIELVSIIEASGLINLSSLRRKNNEFKFKHRIINSNGITIKEMMKFIDGNELVFLKKVLNNKGVLL